MPGALMHAFAPGPLSIQGTLIVIISCPCLAEFGPNESSIGLLSEGGQGGGIEKINGVKNRVV